MSNPSSNPRPEADPFSSGGGTTPRTFSADDLAFLNRMTTTGQVLPSVAHELNNTLQTITGLVEILMIRGQLPSEGMDKIQRISEQTAKAAGMLRELVAFSRRDGAARKIDLRRAVERAVAFRRYHLSRGRVAVLVNEPEEGSFVAQADSQHVTQVLVNLILNAEEAIGDSEVREIRIALFRDATVVGCEVRDSGRGFSDEARGRAGQPFFTTKSGTAAGLGLAVSRELVERDGGRLELQGDAPVTTIRVQWPAAETTTPG